MIQTYPNLSSVSALSSMNSKKERGGDLKHAWGLCSVTGSVKNLLLIIWVKYYNPSYQSKILNQVIKHCLSNSSPSLRLAICSQVWVYFCSGTGAQKHASAMKYMYHSHSILAIKLYMCLDTKSVRRNCKNEVHTPYQKPDSQLNKAVLLLCGTWVVY